MSTTNSLTLLSSVIRAGDSIPLPGHDSLPDAAHVFEADAIRAVDMALTSGRALLVRGEPGTGKTQLARAVAEVLKWALVSKTTDSRTEARDLLWTFDAVGRLAEAQLQAALHGSAIAAAGKAARNSASAKVREAVRERNFVHPGPVWWALNWPSAIEHLSDTDLRQTISSPDPNWRAGTRCVLLLDEIDKADPAVPNGLLEVLAAGRFDVPGFASGVKSSGEAPLVIVTTNEERALPDAFLRRCLVLHLALPREDRKLVSFLIDRGASHFSESFATVRESAADLLLQQREAMRVAGLNPPGQAEYLDILRSLEVHHPKSNDPSDESEAERERAQLALLSEIARFALEKHATDADAAGGAAG